MTNEVAQRVQDTLRLQLEDFGIQPLRNMCRPVHILTTPTFG